MTGTSISSGTYLVCNYGPALVRERGVKGLEGGVVKVSSGTYLVCNYGPALVREGG